MNNYSFSRVITNSHAINNSEPGGLTWDEKGKVMAVVSDEVWPPADQKML